MTVTNTELDLLGKASRVRCDSAAFGRNLLMRTAALAVVSSVSVVSLNSPAAAQGVEERDRIVVTATKRETSLQETAAAVSVVSEDAIEKRRLAGMEDYLAGLPGVSFQDRGTGANSITIRGIGLGNQLDANSPVGSYFGEVPITGTAPRVNGQAAGNADFRMVDIERVELLRGPQGTLYGSGSMGGTLRIIPNAPNLQEAEGKVGAEYSNTARNGGNNYMLQAVANAPLIEDELAVRAVAYRYDNDGYIRNVAGSNPDDAAAAAIAAGAFAEDRDHVGGDKTTGLRVSVLWQPSPEFSAALTLMRQRVEQDGYKEVELNLPGKYEQSRVKVGDQGNRDEFVDDELEVANLVLEYDLGWGSLLNSTSFLNAESEADVELSFLGSELSVPFLGTSSHNFGDKEFFVNEFRFASEFAGPFQVLAGMYYEDRTVNLTQDITWNGPLPGPDTAFYFNAETGSSQKQIAGFGELAFTPVDPLTLTFGVRYFNFTQGITLSRTFGVPGDTEGLEESIDGVNYKANLSYKFSDQLFAYAQWSQGFREPRIQGQVIPEYDMDNDGLVEFADGIEREVQEGLLDPDTVDNYEAGIRFNLADNRIQGSLTGFIIDWEGIPIVPALTEFSGAALYFNAGEARAKGLEFEASAEVVDGLFAEIAASWIESTLTEDAEGLGAAGDDLPGSADYNVKAALEKRFSLAGNDAFVRGDYTYVSEYYSFFMEAPPPAGNYHLVDLSAGVAIDNVNLGVFVKNLTNADDFTWVDNVLLEGRAYRLRPRTIGVNASLSF